MFDSSGVYAFPIAGDPATYRWTHYHWDGTNAADLEARFGLTRAQFEAATRAPLVAITSGTALHHSGNIGGLGYVLQGDDGIDYYYGHMSELWAPDGARVEAGQPLGRIGNTGGTAQFIEPHLHLAIGPRDTLWTQQPSDQRRRVLANAVRSGVGPSAPTPTVPFAQPGWLAGHPSRRADRHPVRAQRRRAP
ncbi:MAG: M23 family metallopeptidase [Microthrixaceae bacterium]|nr:M23 family metallopeptidase [Microthrixaceae bacterium]